MDTSSIGAMLFMLAVFGIAFAVLFVKAPTPAEQAKASLLFLVWLIVAIGFVVWLLF